MAGEIPTDITGLYQYIIGGLITVTTALAGANAWQWKEGNKINTARLGERDVLNKALTDANLALKELSETSKRRNEVQEKLGELIGQVSIALKMLTERLDLQHEHTNKDLERAIEIVSSMADSIRQITSEMQHIRNDIRK